MARRHMAFRRLANKVTLTLSQIEEIEWELGGPRGAYTIYAAYPYRYGKHCLGVEDGPEGDRRVNPYTIGRAIANVLGDDVADELMASSYVEGIALGEILVIPNAVADPSVDWDAWDDERDQ